MMTTSCLTLYLSAQIPSLLSLPVLGSLWSNTAPYHPNRTWGHSFLLPGFLAWAISPSCFNLLNSHLWIFNQFTFLALGCFSSSPSWKGYKSFIMGYTSCTYPYQIQNEDLVVSFAEPTGSTLRLNSAFSTNTPALSLCSFESTCCHAVKNCSVLLRFTSAVIKVVKTLTPAQYNSH